MAAPLQTPPLARRRAPFPRANSAAAGGSASHSPLRVDLLLDWLQMRGTLDDSYGNSELQVSTPCSPRDNDVLRLLPGRRNHHADAHTLRGQPRPDLQHHL